MSTRPHRPPRLAAGIGVCAALLVAASSCSGDAVPGEAGPHLTGELAEALEPGAVSTDTVAATAPLPEAGVATARPAAEETTGTPVPSPDSSPPPSTSAAPAAAEEATGAPVSDPGSSPPPSTSAPPVEPAVSEAPARDCSPRIADDFRITDTSPAAASIEVSKAAFGCAHEVGLAFADDPAAISALASQDIEGPLLLADSRLGVPLTEELRRLEPQRVVVARIDERSSRRALHDLVVEHAQVEHVEVEHVEVEHGRARRGRARRGRAHGGRRGADL